MTTPCPGPWCALVGAGPGDPELLTLKALRTLRRATLLLVDDLVSDGVLQLALQGRRYRTDPDFAPPDGNAGSDAVGIKESVAGVPAPSTRSSEDQDAHEVRVVHVGKRGGCRSTPQAFIERLMIGAALAGEKVVRLKGGDPFVFGRGGEEAETLRAHGIEVDVVNGITSGLAAATALGVPWTHRDHAHGVMLVTGHAREDADGPDWSVLGAAAAQGLTLVIYMGMARLERLQTGLRGALTASTPAAIVQSAGTAQERFCLTTLGHLVEDALVSGMQSPSIIIIGDVLRARAGLQGATTAACPSDRAA